MGINIKDIIEPKKIDVSDLSNKVLAVDSFNLLYQFLTSIRQPDGTPLKDRHGNITSHLIGLFSRTTKLMSKKIKFVFVFDGEVPDLKTKERERRKAVKEDAKQKYELAVKENDVDLMKKYAARTTSLTPEMVEESKELLRLLGIPVVQAPSEGEAQASYMASKGDAFAVVSQDGDSLLFGAPRLLRNFSLTQRKKVLNKLAYERNGADLVSLKETLDALNITREQLIIYAILVGTDYNIGGVKGIGPKTALKLVNEYKDRYNDLFIDVKWSEFFDISWETIFELIKNIPVTDDYELKWDLPDREGLKKLLVEKHDFSENRVDTVLDELNAILDSSQKDLSAFF